MIILLVVGATNLAAPAAGAQTPTTSAAAPTAGTAHPTPVLTVSDPQIAPCGTITATGASFRPGAEIAVVVSGKGLPNKVFSDATGGFTFETTVTCDQTSGVVPVQASDGTTSLAIQVAIAAPKATTTVAAIDAAAPAAGAASPSRFDRWAIPVARVVLLVIMAVELVVLVRWRARRRKRRDTPLDAR